MIVFNCTKAASDFFSVKKQGNTITNVEESPYKTIEQSIENSILPEHGEWHWLVHAIKVRRKTILIAMDYHSRFAICFSELIKGDDAFFVTQFEKHLIFHAKLRMDSMDATDGFISNSIERYFNANQAVKFFKRGDRSVQAHINDAAWFVKLDIDDHNGFIPKGVDLISLDNKLNSMPRTKKGEKEYFASSDLFLTNWLKIYTNTPATKFPLLFNTLNKKRGYVFDPNLPDTKLSDTSEYNVRVNTTLPNNSTNVVSFADFKKNNTKKTNLKPLS